MSSRKEDQEQRMKERESAFRSMDWWDQFANPNEVKSGFNDPGFTELPKCHDHPEPEYTKPEFPNPSCICNKPLLLYIPGGQHIHCPVHPDHIIYGGPTCYA